MFEFVVYLWIHSTLGFVLSGDVWENKKIAVISKEKIWRPERKTNRAW